MEFGRKAVKLSLQPRLSTMKKATWFIFLLIIIMSCLNDPDCFRLNQNIVGISFRVMGSSKSDTLRMYEIAATNTDDLFYENTEATGIGLPLDYTTTQTQFVILSTRGYDTISFSYEVDAQFVSEECGSKFAVKNLAVIPGYSFDSMRVINPHAGTTAGGNIEIFRCPRTDTMAIAFRQLTLSRGTSSSQSLFVGTNGITPEFTGETLYENQSVSVIYLPVNLNDTLMVVNFDQVENGARQLILSYKLIDTVRYRPCGRQIFPESMVINPVSPELSFDSVGHALENGVRIKSVRDPFDPMINIYRCPELDIAGIYFRNRGGTRDSTVSLTNVTVDFQETNYAPADSTNFVRVPLNKNNTATTVFFTFENGDTKTITFRYRTVQHTRYKNACSDQNTLFSNIVIGASEFPDGKVVQPALQSIPTKNIEIFL
jgi:hypothetical protein